MTPGQQLSAWMKANKINQTELAPRIGVTTSMLSHILSGRKRPSLDTANRIASATEGAVPTAAWSIQPTEAA